MYVQAIDGILNRSAFLISMAHLGIPVMFNLGSHLYKDTKYKLDFDSMLQTFLLELMTLR